MWPIVSFAGVWLPTESVLIAMGLFVGLFTLFLAARRKRLSIDFLADNSAFLLIVFFLVARVGEMLWYQYPMLSFPFFWRDTGFSFQVGLLGFLVGLWWLARQQRQEFLPWLDVVTLTAIASALFFHVGAFLSGDMYGSPTALPWGVIYTHPEAATLTTLPVHPTQVYAFLITLALFVSAALLFKKTRTAGKTAAFLLFAVSSAYFLIDFLRDDSAPSFFGLRVSQFLWLGCALLGLIISMKLRIRRTDHRNEFTISHTTYD